MKVFISWSGNASRAVAVALREWLPSVVQAIEPYVSSEDIEKGARWSAEIAQQLNDTAFGVICVTKDNVQSSWINFEAGALSKSVDTSRVSPFLLDIRPTDLVGPLSQFQATLPQLEDVTRLLRSINSSTERPVDEARLAKSVEMWWPALEEQLNVIRSEEHPAETKRHRETADMIEELLEITRGIQRELLTGDAAGAQKETELSSRARIERIDLLEKLILAKLEAAFAVSHDVAFETNVASGDGVARLDAMISPREVGGELYFIELKYISNSRSLIVDRIQSGVHRLSMARRAYTERSSGPIRCMLLFVIAEHDENLLRRLKSKLGILPDEMEALVLYESELRQIAPSDLKERLMATASPPDLS